MIWVRLSGEAGEGGARVGKRVHADPEPRHTVAARDADQAEEQDDDHLHRGETTDGHAGGVYGFRQRAEVHGHDRADEDPENKKEAALREQVRLTRLVDQLGDLPHRPVHGEVLELRVLGESEQQSERANHEAPQQQRPSPDAAKERGLIEIGQHERGLAASRMLKRRN